MPRRGEGAFPYFVLGDEQTRTSGLVAVLRPVGKQGGQPRFHVRGNVDHKGRAHISVQRGVEDLVRTVRWEQFRAAAGKLKLAQARRKAGFVAQGGRGVVVRVSALPIGQKDHAWPQSPQNRGNFQAIGKRVLDCAVGQIECFAVCDPEHAGGCFGFPGALLRRASGPGFTLGQVKDCGLCAQRALHQQRAPASLFHVVAVGGDGENVYRSGGVQVVLGVWRLEVGIAFRSIRGSVHVSDVKRGALHGDELIINL